MNFSRSNAKELSSRIAEASLALNGVDSSVKADEVFTYLRKAPALRKTFVPILETEFPFLHSRPATEKDFHEFCDRKGIRVCFQEDFPDGVWVVAEGYHFFCINSELESERLRYVMFHEVAHYLFHIPTQSNDPAYSVDPKLRARQHIEAEIVTFILCQPEGY